MSQRTQTHDVPQTIISRLQRIRRRERGMRLARGLILTGTVLLAAMMVAMALDWLVVLFDPRWRAVLTLASLGVAGVTLIVYGVHPLITPRRLASLARDVDASIPELEERWSTITELAENDDPQSQRGSERLIHQVRHEAEQMQDRVVPDRIVTGAAIRCNAFGFGLVAALLLVFLVFAFDTTRVLMQRFWMPTRPITLTSVRSLTGDRVVPMREPLLLEAAIEGRPRETARLFLNEPDARRTITLHPATDDPRLFIYKLKSIEQPCTYRVRSGDGQTDWHTVTPVERPNIAQVRYRIIPPAYTNMEAEESHTLPRHTRALEGSLMEVAFQPTRPIASLTLQFDEQHDELLPADHDHWYGYETTLTEDMGFSVVLVDEHGLENLNPPQCRVAVFPDKPPSVEILSPDDEIVVRPEDTIEIEYKARDDYGIAEAELVVTIERKGVAGGQTKAREEEYHTGDSSTTTRPTASVADGSQPDATKDIHVIPIPLEDAQNAKHVHRTVALDLKPFGLEHGQELSYMIRVRDTRAATAESGPPGREGSQQQPFRDQEQQPSDQHKTHVAENQQQPSDPMQVNASNEEDSEPKTPGEPSNRPPDNMPRRMLDLEKNGSCSQQQRLKVDKWVGKFEGQQRRKLQLAIDNFLKQLDAELEAAQKPAEALLDRVRPVADSTEAGQESAITLWTPQEDEQLRSARDHLDRALHIIADLKTQSADTPYAFIGLQLDDIGLFHVGPARAHLAEARIITEKPAERFKNLQQGTLHIARARELLASLTRRYEAVKREEHLADKLEHLAEMHQVFVEDMHMMLKSQKPRLNPRTGEMIEMDISDEYKKAIEDYYARLKEVMDELARILADDPELLRRYMAMMRNECSTIRDQLTLLARRQIAIRDDTAGWIMAAEDGRPALLSKFEAQRVFEQLKLAELTARFNDDVSTWMPDDADDDEGHLETLGQLADDAARQAREISKRIARGGVTTGLEPTQSLVDVLFNISDTTSMAMAHECASDDVIHFCTRRLEAMERLTHQYRGWLVKVRNLDEKRFGRGAAYDQELLRRDTMTFADKLDVRVGPLSNLSAEIGRKMRALEQLVSRAIVDHQTEATVSLRLEDLTNAREHEDRAVELFAEAEDNFDEILTLVEKAIAEQNEGQSPGGVGPPPTLEKLLAMLEREMDACEKLGSVVRMNLSIVTDSAMPGEGSGAGAGQDDGTGSGQAQADAQGQAAPTPQNEQARQLAEALARAAQARLAENAREMEKARQQAEAEARKLAEADPDGGPRVTDSSVSEAAPGDETATHADWATFGSHLDADLQQARDQVPPERYREAVDAYLRSISEMSAASGSPAN